MLLIENTTSRHGGEYWGIIAEVSSKEDAIRYILEHDEERSWDRGGDGHGTHFLLVKDEDYILTERGPALLNLGVFSYGGTWLQVPGFEGEH